MHLWWGGSSANAKNNDNQLSIRDQKGDWLSFVINL